MAKQLYEFEEIDRSIKKMPSPATAKPMTAAALKTASISQIQQKVCGVYCPLRPLLVTLSNFPLIPPTWRAAIKTFIAVMDSICNCP